MGRRLHTLGSIPRRYRYVEVRQRDWRGEMGGRRAMASGRDDMMQDSMRTLFDSSTSIPSQRTSRSAVRPGGLVLLLLAFLSTGLLASTDPFEPAGTGGAVYLDRALARIENHKRVLVIGAHPDDEDTALLTLVSRGLGGEAAYLSLSRGDGGQNLIGSELGESLGVLRTEELLAARRIDGARQYFSRAYDFGYSKSLEEALTQWPKEMLLEDAVRVIRRFRPQVVVAIFPPDERAGHGQHQASGLIAELAIEAAASESAFPEMADEGLEPWRTERFFREAWFDPESADTFLPVGILDPLTGRTLYQIAMESRSQHRCQSFGSLQPLGPRDVRLARQGLAEGETTDGTLFGDLETRLRGVADLVAEEHRSAMLGHLMAVENLVGAARSVANSSDYGLVVPPLRDLLLELRAARSLAESGGAAHAAAILVEKERWANEVLATALGLVVDATTESDLVIPGEDLAVTVRVSNG
ncbi:MAG: PIG-L family deacetylase, partial [Thermoanaerobaculia bacterium]|nr:PIG-L family deacetylase [Thermoanaerobaculia bacterium]